MYQNELHKLSNIYYKINRQDKNSDKEYSKKYSLQLSFILHSNPVNLPWKNTEHVDKYCKHDAKKTRYNEKWKQKMRWCKNNIVKITFVFVIIWWNKYVVALDIDWK